MTKNFHYGLLEDTSDTLDSTFWENASDMDKFKEAWRLVELAFELQGKSKDELRFQRSTFTFQQKEY
jgi:hypothetical protein